MSSRSTTHEKRSSGAQDDIAIIGMACLFPGAPDLGSYWRNILSKVDSITDPPPEAWDPDVFYDPGSTANDRVYCKRGGFIGPLAYFDPLRFGVMPRTVEGGEPDQWLALQVAHDALADAGYGTEIPERHSTAVILGRGTYLNRGNTIHFQHSTLVEQTVGILKLLHPEYAEADLALLRQELKRSLPPFNADTVPGLIPNVIAGRIANRLDLMGPAYTVDAACASSLVALDMAARGLRDGEYSLALVGGAHVVTPVPVAMLFCQLNALSRRERIRPFDKDADGTVLGEGIGMVVLKRRAEAERDGNRIYALIKGAGISSDGRGLGVTAPRLEGEVLAIRRAYEAAGISPRSVGLIEAHGTATPVGDVTEVQALAQVFGPRDGRQPWCGLGAVKSMIGHLMPAAGVASLIKTALALHHKVLPPTLNVDEPNPRLELEQTPFYINTETRPWIHGDPHTPRRAGVNAFGFGGINAHVILEEYPTPEDSARQRRSGYVAGATLPRWDSEVCILAAGSRAGLTERAQQLQHFLQAGSQAALKDLAYTLNVPLDDGTYRLAIVAASTEDLQHKLGRALERLSDPQCRRIKEFQGIYYFDPALREAGQLAFLFPGEGSQYVNLLADLCIHFPEVREGFDFLDRLFAGQDAGYLPSDFIFPRPAFSEAERAAAESRLWHMKGAVEAVLSANGALFTILSGLQVRPDALVGHSTGEYSALLAAGMIGVADATGVGSFTQELNQLYQQTAAGQGVPRAALLAVGADVEALSSIIDASEGRLYLAMDNCPHQAVLVGEEDAIAQATEQLSRRSLIYERLPFDRPYHTPLFEPFAEPLRALFERWLVAPPRTRIYSCTTTAPFPADVAQAREVAVAHWMRAVEFRKTIEAMYADGVRIFVEVGPRGNLSSFIDDILRGRPHLAAPANVANRSGISQLNHLVGLLAAQGVPMQLDYLYARRSPRRLSLDQAAATEGDGKAATGRMKLITGWPAMTISEEARARLLSRRQAEVTAAPAPPAAAPRAAAQPAAPALAANQHNNGHATAQSGLLAHPAHARPASASQVMSAHLQTMEQLLAVQQEIMQTYLAGRGAAALPSAPVAPWNGHTAPSNGHATTSNGKTPAEPTFAPNAPGPAESTAPALSEASAAAHPARLDAGAITSLLLQLVAERTGYPVEMLDLDLDLEADLGIDSIKRVEILGSFQQQTGLLQAEDLEALAGRKTLRELIDFLATRPVGERRASATPAPVGSEPAASLPFIGTIVSLAPGEELVARRELRLEEDLFLRDHTFGFDVSVTDPALTGLPVLPLTVSMEMLAEAAVVLAPGMRLVEMRDIRAYRWVALDQDRLTLQFVARRRPGVAGHEFTAQMFEADASGAARGSAAPIVEGVMVFDATYPAPPAPSAPTLPDERPASWPPERLYEDSMMFHGPAFRGVLSMDGWSDDGARATIQALPADGLFRSNPRPAFVADPVLLDQVGQVVGFWGLERLATGIVMFPFRIESTAFYGPNPAAHLPLRCRVYTQMVGEWQVRSDIEVVGADGRVWLRVAGWEDRCFELPQPFSNFIFSSPRAVKISTPWPIPADSPPALAGVQVYRLGLNDFSSGFFTAHGGIWRRALARQVLSRRERELWHSLRFPEPRRLEWLIGRGVAKDAVRHYLEQHYGLQLCPADIEILPDGDGRPVIGGRWLDQVPPNGLPLLSLSHAGGVAVAVVGDREDGAGLGVDVEPLDRMHADTEAAAFAPQELALLATAGDDWPLRLWCAKEAVSKALGQGLAGGPRALVAQALDAGSGTVRIGVTGELARRAGVADDLTVSAWTAREADLVVAIALYTADRRETKL